MTTLHKTFIAGLVPGTSLAGHTVSKLAFSFTLTVCEHLCFITVQYFDLIVCDGASDELRSLHRSLTRLSQVEFHALITWTSPFLL